MHKQQHKQTYPHGLPYNTVTVKNMPVHWCAATDLRPYGLTKQARFIDCLSESGFFSQVALHNKVFFKV